MTTVLVTTAYWERHDKTVSVCATTHGGVQRSVRFPAGRRPMTNHLEAALTASSAGLTRSGLSDSQVIGVSHSLDGTAAARFTLRYRTGFGPVSEPPLDADLSVRDGIARLRVLTGNVRHNGAVVAYWCNGAASATLTPSTEQDPHRLAAEKCAAMALSILDIVAGGPFEETDPVGDEARLALAGERLFLLQCPVAVR